MKEYNFVTGMVEEHHSHVCVGGPLAGRRYLAKSEMGFCTAIPPKVRLTPSNKAADTVSFTTVNYKRDTFRTADGDVSFWVPNDQTALQTMTLLLDNYETNNGQSYKTPNEVRKEHKLPPLDYTDD